MCGTEPSMHKGENSYMPFFEKEKGHFTARGNVNYTLQCAFHITLSVHACPCLYWMIVRCYSNPHIHLALLDNEDSRASAERQRNATPPSPSRCVAVLLSWMFERSAESVTGDPSVSSNNRPRLSDLRQKERRPEPRQSCDNILRV